MKIDKKDIFPMMGEYLLAVVLGCFLGMIADIVIQSAYKQKRVDMLATILALAPVLVLQLILAVAFQFVSYISGAGFWLGVLFCHGGNGDAPYVDTPRGYFLLGMVTCMIVYGVAACVAQHIGYKQQIKSREKY